ncbi:MAG: FAD-dependent oxidoreductase [Gammaproteobacteria bacterium]|nr:FAD-dependent oxidoreductase [Gammaproteobacteria bacterium]
MESAKQLGGRARNVSWDGNSIDNGQHLMIGAYERMLTMMSSIGIDTAQVFQRQAMDLSIYDTNYPPLRLSSIAYLPWPLSVAWNLVVSVEFLDQYKSQNYNQILKEYCPQKI